jgi:5'-nucleotidase
MAKTPRERVVVTNDDGIASEGLRLLAAAAADADLDVVVAAPDREASGSSAAMTPIAAGGHVIVERRALTGLPEARAYAVRARPAFIAFTAVRGAFGPPPALLLSGINKGPNTGKAVLHSGTVGAALTAATASVPAAAFSLDLRSPRPDGPNSEHWETASVVAERILRRLHHLRPGVVLNVNVPNVSPGRLRGIRRGTLAPAGAVQVSIAETEAGHQQVTMTENAEPPAPGTDSALLAAGYSSVTPLLAVCELPGEELAWLPTDTEGLDLAPETSRSASQLCILS